MKLKNWCLTTLMSCTMSFLMLSVACAHRDGVDAEGELGQSEDNQVQGDVADAGSGEADVVADATTEASAESDPALSEQSSIAEEATNPDDIDQNILLAPDIEQNITAMNQQSEPTTEVGTENELALDDSDPTSSSSASISSSPSDLFEKAPMAKKTRSSKMMMGSSKTRIPKIPAEAFEKDGALLNRFYFIRNEDTAESVATVLYQDPSSAELLKKWNSSWSVGSLVFYSSPSNPQDTQIKSFFEEAGAQPNMVKVKSGDWLSKIATQELGNPASWKEIAVLNGLEKPDSIEVGQQLAIYPRDLSSMRVATTAVEKPADPEPIVAQTETPTETQPQANATDLEVQEPDEPPPMEVAETARPAANKPSSGESFFENEMFSLVIGGGLVVLLLALIIMNRKKKAKNSADSDDDSKPSRFKRS